MQHELYKIFKTGFSKVERWVVALLTKYNFKIFVCYSRTIKFLDISRVKSISDNENIEVMYCVGCGCLCKIYTNYALSFP